MMNQLLEKLFLSNNSSSHYLDISHFYDYLDHITEKSKMKIYRHIFLPPLLLLAFCAINLHAQPGRWAPPVNISNHQGSCDYPDMTIGVNGNIHVVWEDYSRLGSFYWRDILYVVYDGYEWSEPEQVSAMDTTYSYSPAVAVDSLGRPHVVWNHRAIFPDADAYYSHKTDTGWTEPLNLAPHGSTQYAPDICIDSRGFIHVVWADYLTGNGDILHRYYDGVEWSDYTNISNDPIDSAEPCIKVDTGDNLNLAWRQLSSSSMNNEIFYSKYDGIYWSEKTNISQSTYQSSTYPCLALDSNNNPHVVWRQTIGGFYCEIYYTYYDGEEWMEPADITNLGLRSDYPSLAINSHDVKCMLFSVSSQGGDQYVNFIYCIDSVWSYPDTVFDRYTSNTSSIGIDEDDIIQATISTIVNLGNSDQFYTYNTQFSSAVENRNVSFLNYNNLQCYPNPFNTKLNIIYSISNKSDIQLSIYNINGQFIKKLISGEFAGGQYLNTWEGNNQFGEEVSSGIYFLQLVIDNHLNLIQKSILIK